MSDKKVLIAGESWTVHSIHQKGFDSFTTTEYAEGVHWLREALRDGGWEVHYMPAHVAATDFPFTAEELSSYDCVVVSDVGANTFLLHPDTFVRSKPLADRLAAIRDYVAAGGGLVMVGGYLTFQGIDAKAQYAGTAIEEALPITISRHDDRREVPAGAAPVVEIPEHPLAAGLSGPWPALLGYNRVTAREEAEVVVSIDGDPLVVGWRYGHGHAVAFTSDCGPHWAPPTFVDWPGYGPLWCAITGWAAGQQAVLAE